MTAEERLNQEIENYNRDENYYSLLNFSMQERRFIIEFAESLAKERSVEFAMDLKRMKLSLQGKKELYESQYDTFLAEKRNVIIK